jgi:ankyrin repeat protein
MLAQLTWSIRERRMDVLARVIDGGVNLDTVGEAGYAPLALAAALNRYEAMQVLLEAGANPDGVSDPSFSNPLHAHIGNAGAANPKVIDLLVEYGANIEVRDREGMTPLLKSVAYLNLKAMGSLIAYGADLNAKDKKYRRPLHLCVRRSLQEWDIAGEAAQILIDAGADPNVLAKAARGEPKEGWPLVKAVSLSCATVFNKILAMKDLDQRSLDAALVRACTLGLHVSFSKALLDRGADPLARSVNDRTLLQVIPRNRDELKRVIRSAQLSERIINVMSVDDFEVGQPIGKPAPSDFGLL